MATIDVKVPAIGDYTDVPIIEVLVKPGDAVAANDSLVTLESEKATMDVPAPAAGTVRELKVKVGDKVSEGSLVLTLDAADAGAEAPGGDGRAGGSGKPGGRGGDADEGPPVLERRTGAASAAASGADAPSAGRGERGSARGRAEPAGQRARSEGRPEAAGEPARPEGRPEAGGERARSEGRPEAAGERARTEGRQQAAGEPARPEGRPQAPGAGPPRTVEVKVPAIGDYTDVPVIKVLVKAGESVAVDQSLVTLESEKATMDVPSPAAGEVRELRVKVGDKVSEGSVIAILDAAAAPQAAERPERPEPERAEAAPPARGAQPPQPARASTAPPPAAREAEAEAEEPGRRRAHASPSIRKLARELGVDLSRVEGSGPRSRILREDVQRFVKDSLSRPAAGGGAGLDLLPWPKVDFAKFGPVEATPLSRIRKLSKANLSRNWVMIPHVTQHDEADITELEQFRVSLNEEGAKEGVKVTLLAFLVKASVAALRRFPEVNASLDGDQLVLKRYFHIGFAADTPNGLVVPVVRDADRKGVLEIARELSDLAAKARDGKLGLGDMQGGSFSISSLGGIGGTAFTPIINAPEVAILGVSRSVTKPVWDGAQFTPRLMLPLSLSYDHRVIDGALAARFTSFLAKLLGDMRRAML